MSKFDPTYIKQYLPAFCARYDYPQEATDLFADVLTRIEADPELSRDFYAPIHAYAEGKKIKYSSYLSGNNGMCRRIADSLKISTYTADFVFALSLIPYLQQRYAEAGLDEEIFYDGMIDFRCKLWECKKVYDVWGSFVCGWFRGWFNMTRFQFGRLQYEPKKHIWIHCKLGEHNEKRVPLFGKFLDIHIPSMGRLTPESVEDSFRRAYVFFRGRGYGRDIVYHTSSWLLNPDHYAMFAPDSNIISFMNRFRTVSVHEEKDNNDFWRIYDRPYDPASPDCSGDTTMQKGYAAIIMSGGHIKHGSGVFVFDGDKFYR